MEVNDDSQVWGNAWFFFMWESVRMYVCVCLCACHVWVHVPRPVFSAHAVCTRNMSVFCLEASSLSVPFVSIIKLVLGGLWSSSFCGGCQYLFVCLFTCLGSNANMTMCALDTRNDSRRDTNAAINVLLQFKRPLLCLYSHCSFSVLRLYILYSGVTDLTCLQLWWVVVATAQQPQAR